MTTTLLDYARQHFPGHTTDRWRNDDPQLELSSHTVVVHVVGAHRASAVVTTMQRLASHSVAAIVVKPVPPSVILDQPKDSGVFDLPNEHVITAAAGGALFGGAVGLAVGVFAGTVMSGLVLALFGMATGGIVAAVWCGGARRASEQAVSRPNAPGRNIAIVAAFLHDEATATTLAQQIAAADHQYDIRILGPDGAWHAPIT